MASSSPTNQSGSTAEWKVAHQDALAHVERARCLTSERAANQTPENSDITFGLYLGLHATPVDVTTREGRIVAIKYRIQAHGRYAFLDVDLSKDERLEITKLRGNTEAAPAAGMTTQRTETSSPNGAMPSNNNACGASATSAPPRSDQTHQRLKPENTTVVQQDPDRIDHNPARFHDFWGTMISAAVGPDSHLLATYRIVAWGKVTHQCLDLTGGEYFGIFKGPEGPKVNNQTLGQALKAFEDSVGAPGHPIVLFPSPEATSGSCV